MAGSRGDEGVSDYTSTHVTVALLRAHIQVESSLRTDGGREMLCFSHTLILMWITVALSC